MGHVLRLVHFAMYLAWALVTAWPGEVSAAAEESRLALLIGNAAYPRAPLANPVNDLRLMERTLKELGFEVINRVIKDTVDYTTVDQAPRLQGRNVHAILVPKKNKK